MDPAINTIVIPEPKSNSKTNIPINVANPAGAPTTIILIIENMNRSVQIGFTDCFTSTSSAEKSSSVVFFGIYTVDFL